MGLKWTAWDMLGILHLFDYSLYSSMGVNIAAFCIILLLLSVMQNKAAAVCREKK